MSIGENMKRLRKAARLSQGELAQMMTDRGRQWHQNTVSRIELGRQELDSLGDINALQGILGTELLDGTALSAGRETDKTEQTKIYFRAAREMERIKTNLEELSQAAEHLQGVIEELKPTPRATPLTPSDLVKIVTDIDPRADPKEVEEELRRALAGLDLPHDGSSRDREVFDGIYKDFESRMKNPAEGTGDDAETYLQERARHGVDQETP